MSAESASGWGWAVDPAAVGDQVPAPAPTVAQPTPPPPTKPKVRRTATPADRIPVEEAPKSPVVRSRPPSRASRVTNGPEQASTSAGPSASPAGHKGPYTTYASASEIKYTPKRALKEGQKMVRVVSDKMSRMTIGNEMRREDWQNDLEFLENEEPLPAVLIAVCGATGSGKSSVLNAILEDNIVPTSGMRACTAVVTKISYNKKRRICARVTFMSKDDWMKELGLLLNDLTLEDGRTLPTSESELNLLSLPGKVAWEKIRALCPAVELHQLKDMSAQKIVDLSPAVFAKLDTSEEIEAKTSDKFAEKIEKYINSADDAANGALWPLIREVHIQCHADALSSGAVLVDLPGVADANAARNNVAAGYMKDAHRIWIVAPITRAVDDGTAQKLLGDMFKTQLLMDGKYNSQCVTFIASKSDDVSCKEIITALKLRKDPALLSIDARIRDIETKKKDLDQRLKRKKSAVNNLGAELNAVTAEQQSPSRPPSLQPKKRKRLSPTRPRKRRRPDDDSTSGSESDSNSSDGGTESAPESEADAPPETSMSQWTGFDPPAHTEDTDGSGVMDHQMSKKVRMKSLERKLAEATQEYKSMLGEMATFEEETMTAQRDKNAFCSLARSNHAKVVLKEQFRSGLEEIHGKIPAADLQSIDLPVFTISSRDYVRLTKQVTGDGKPVCFTHVKYTGIPALRDWCHELTKPFREEAALRYLWRLASLAARIRAWVEGIEARADTPEARRRIREKYETKRSARSTGDTGIAAGLSQDLATHAIQCIAALEHTFREGIAGSCKIGAQKASNGAIKTAETFFKPWQTWKAVLRRKGDWEKNNLNLNQMLLEPFIKEIASSFAETMDANLFALFRFNVRKTVYNFLTGFEATATDRIGGARVSKPLIACQKSSDLVVDEMISGLKGVVRRGRSDASRVAVPCVKARLEHAYTVALEQTGPGSINRQQQFFKTYLERNKEDIFESASSAILESLARIVQSVNTIAHRQVGELAKKIEVDLAVLWEEVHDTDVEAEARKEAKAVMTDIEAQVKLWQDAGQLRPALQEP